MSFTPPELSELVRYHYPNLAQPPVITPIATGKFNSSYWVEADGERLVLRIAPPRDAVYVFYEKEMMRQEPQLHELLLAQTNVPVARIVAFDDSHALIDCDYMLMERLPGRPWSEALHVDLDHVLQQVGVHLAATHRLTAEQYGYLGAHQPMPPQSSWVDAFAIMWHKMIDDIVAVGYYDAAESRMMRQLLDQQLHLFDRPVAASLLHMDIWQQNILVDDAGSVTGLVDWDRALWGDPEIEFAVLDYCGISEPAFWEGYGQARDRSPEANLRQIFYLLYEVQKYIVIYHGRNGDANGAQQKKRQVMNMVRANL